MKYKSIVQYIAAFLLMALSLNASGFTCNQESPNLKIEGKKYFDINEAKSLTRNQKSDISKLFKHFEGKKLTGNGSTSECKGSIKNAKKSTTFETLNAEIKQFSNGKIVISLNSFIKKKKTTRNEKLDYFGNNNHYHINELTNNKLVVSYKLRKQKIMNEEITEISVNYNTLTIKTTLYIGGHFGLQKTRKLNL